MNALPMVCVPFAGAGGAFFHRWRAIAPESIEVVAVSPPGRERKIAEEPFRDAVHAARSFVTEGTERFVRGGAVILFGHSLGAVIAYEMALRLEAMPGMEVVRLIVSGAPGPWAARSRRASGLPDGEFLELVQEFAGYDHEALRNPELREMILPTLRADVQMHEDYRPSGQEKLTAPISSFRGHADNLVTVDEAEQWADTTTGEFERVEVEGGHMYLVEQPGPILQRAHAAASQWVAADHARPSAGDRGN